MAFADALPIAVQAETVEEVENFMNMEMRK
jgi:hypothetical protein